MIENLPKDTLAMKMARVMSRMTRLEKTGKNSFHKYKFATDADVSDAVRGAMADEGITFLPSLIQYTRDEVGKTRNGTPKHLYTAEFEMIFTDGVSNYRISWFSEALDSEDKGLNKCATAAVKYALLKTFLISTGDEIDPDRNSPNEELGNYKALTRKEFDTLFASAKKEKDISALRKLWERAKNELNDDELAEQVKNSVAKLDA